MTLKHRKSILTQIIAVMQWGFVAVALGLPALTAAAAGIDRKALVERNNPSVTGFDPLSSFSVGNGNFAYTADATGLQSFPELYAKGVPLGTMAQWGWHSFPNPQGYKIEETLKAYDFGKGHKEVYACQFKEPGRARDAANWYRENPHRLHLGIIGFDFAGNVSPSNIKGINQQLDMWRGIIHSRFEVDGKPYEVETAAHPSQDMMAAEIHSPSRTGICFRFPYPTGGHADDACDWADNNRHNTLLVDSRKQSALLKRTLDSTVYYVLITWKGKAGFTGKSRNCFVLAPQEDTFSFTCSFSKDKPDMKAPSPDFWMVKQQGTVYWYNFWTKGAAVDFSHCTDPRARELERRVVLSQYLLAIQSAGNYPPAETGLTYNSWYGKFHLEMIWWHQAWQALWKHSDLLARTLEWYKAAEPIARDIARRQGYAGVRWMKMTDPSGVEAPSNVGSFLIWQQPHYIYLADLIYRANPSDSVLRKYNRLVQETAEFMYSFATYDKHNDRYVLKGFIPAQETLKASTTVNAPFELSYWHYALETAQKWREKSGEKRNPQWDTMLRKLSPLAFNEAHLYLAAENATDTYTNIRLTSDHPAVLGAAGVLPLVDRMVRKDYMKNTLHWVWDKWNWDETWGWDFPMVAMNAARLGEPEKAVGALLMDKRTNTYLKNGHNYQDDRLRVYLPGNGGLLTAVAMMCAGWDGAQGTNPGFPKDGSWDVRWEGLSPLP